DFEPRNRTAIVVHGVLLGLATPWEIPGFIEGLRVTQRAMHAELLGVDMRKQVSALEVAFFFFLGRHDRHVDAKLRRHRRSGERRALLAEIVAPELDHQIAQAEATLSQLRAVVEQAQANKNLAQVTWDRDKGLVEKGWVTPQQGDIDRFT